MSAGRPRHTGHATAVEDPKAVTDTGTEASARPPADTPPSSTPDGAAGDAAARWRRRTADGGAGGTGSRPAYAAPVDGGLALGCAPGRHRAEHRAADAVPGVAGAGTARRRAARPAGRQSHRRGVARSLRLRHVGEGTGLPAIPGAGLEAAPAPEAGRARRAPRGVRRHGPRRVAPVRITGRGPGRHFTALALSPAYLGAIAARVGRDPLYRSLCLLLVGGIALLGSLVPALAARGPPLGRARVVLAAPPARAGGRLLPHP